MTYDTRINDASWLGQKCHVTSLWLTANALGVGKGVAWQEFKAKHLGKTTHHELCVLQGIEPKAQPAIQAVKVDNRKVETSEFSNILARELRSFKSEIKAIVRKEVARQLR